MQVLFARGVEHGTETAGCAAWPGVVDRLEAEILPHMGWNLVSTPDGSGLFAGIDPGERIPARRRLSIGHRCRRPTRRDVSPGAGDVELLLIISEIEMQRSELMHPEDHVHRFTDALEELVP